eukprot:scaffold67425_cov65-Attheya_sp.AAC.1
MRRQKYEKPELAVVVPQPVVPSLESIIFRWIVTGKVHERSGGGGVVPHNAKKARKRLASLSN